MKHSVLALKFEQKGLKLSDRTAIGACRNFGDELAGPCLTMSYQPRNKATMALHAECSSFLGQQCFQIAN